MSNSQTLKQAIIERRTLLRSLATRGIITDSSAVQGVETSLYHDMATFVNNASYVSQAQATLKAAKWYKQLRVVYQDSQLTEPPSWGKFLKSLRDMVTHYDNLDATQVAHVANDLLDEHGALLLLLNKE